MWCHAYLDNIMSVLFNPLSFHTLLVITLYLLLPQMSSHTLARGFTCLWEMRRGMLCCSSQWSCRVNTTACPLRLLWCNGSTSRTAATAHGIPSASPTAWMVEWGEAVWWVGPEEQAEGTRVGWQRATLTALTAVGRSELWRPSLVPLSRCQSTTRTETSP